MNIKRGIHEKIQIHFMNRPNTYNCGDFFSTPLNYFPQFLAIGNCIRHTLDAVRFDYIKSNDFIIIGGGGCIGNKRDHDAIISKLFDITENIIVWGAGTHLTFGQERPSMDYYNRFMSLGVRDYQFCPYNGSILPWVPCVTCMCDEFDKPQVIEREIGVVKHYNYDIDIPNIEKFDSIVQCCHITQVIRFIACCEDIITNSYHAAYWGTLLGKRVVCQPFLECDKFYNLKYMPQIYSGNLHEDLKSATRYKDILNEHRITNLAYFEEIKSLMKIENELGTY